MTYFEIPKGIYLFIFLFTEIQEEKSALQFYFSLQYFRYFIKQGLSTIVFIS